jgi:endonuclease/exonuclease/phosphatase (EEP) superfamily protein YafD
MQLSFQIFMGILAFIALAPLIRTHYWWIRIWDFPRVQVAFLCLITLGLYMWLFKPHTPSDLVMPGLVAIGLVYKAIMIYPFTPFSPIQALRSKVFIPRDGFSLMIANVRMVNTRYAKFLKVVEKADPDILLVNEPGTSWAKALEPLDGRYPYSVKVPLDNTYGMMLYSKLEMLQEKVSYLVEDGIPSIYSVLQLPSGRRFELFCVHPQPPSYSKNTDTREAELLIVAKMAKASRYASIVAGDLNDVAWSYTTKLFKKISGLLDPRIGRGFYNTYNAFIPFFRYPLDHVFYDPAFRLVNLRRLGAFGSDHFPIYLRLNYEPRDADEQETMEVNQSDKEEAEEMIEKGLNSEQNGVIVA